MCFIETIIWKVILLNYMDTILLLLGKDICDMPEVSHNRIRSLSFGSDV